MSPVLGTRLRPVATIHDFPRAREAIDRELSLHQGEQGSIWRTQPPAYHARHALLHLLAALVFPLLGGRHLVRMHLAHAACRGLMALEQFIARFGRDFGGDACLSPLRTAPPSPAQGDLSA